MSVRRYTETLCDTSAILQCPRCQSEDPRIHLNQMTSFGYPLHFCRTCKGSFNELTGTPFSHIEVPPISSLQVLYCRLRFKLRYRDVTELFWLQGFHFTHETVRKWSERFTAEFAEHLRAKRQQTFGRVWSVDETYVKVQGKWCYLYRGMDAYDNLLDVRLSEHQDMEAAKTFTACSAAATAMMATAPARPMRPQAAARPDSKVVASATSAISSTATPKN